MQYKAISSCYEKIKQLLLSYDGRKASLNFIEEIFVVFPESIEILIFLNDSGLQADIDRLVLLTKRQNYKITAETFAPLEHLKPNSLRPIKGSVWIRDNYYIARLKNEKFLMLHKGTSSIPSALELAQIVDSSVWLSELPDIGNILITDDTIFTTKAVLMQLEQYARSRNIDSRSYLQELLFPNSAKVFKVIALGYQYV